MASSLDWPPTDGYLRRIAGDNGADAIRQAGPQRGSNRGRHRCAITLAGTIGYALAGLPHLTLLTAFSRFRIGHRCRSDCADFELGRALRYPLGTQAIEAKTGNQLRLVPAACRRTFPVEPRTSYLNQLR